mgnify:CR=1 FL=1
MPKIDMTRAKKRKGSLYPAPHAKPCAKRERTVLGDAAGLKDFGVNLMRLPPGTWSSQRHWHDKEDEFVFVVSGEVTLVTNKGETVLKAGDCAGFAKGKPDGHQLINKSATDAVVLEVGTRSTDDTTTYSDIDMVYVPRKGYVRKDGTRYKKS